MRRRIVGEHDQRGNLNLVDQARSAMVCDQTVPWACPHYASGKLGAIDRDRFRHGLDQTRSAIVGDHAPRRSNDCGCSEPNSQP